MIADMMTAMIQKKWASDVLTPLSGEASSPSVAIPVIPPFRRRRLTLLRRDRKVKRWGAARAVSAQHQPCLGEPFKPLVDGRVALGEAPPPDIGDRKSVVSGQSVSIRVDLGGLPLLETKQYYQPPLNTYKQLSIP